MRENTKDKIFYLAVTIMVLILIGLSYAGVTYQKNQTLQEQKAEYAFCLETNDVRNQLNTDKDILRTILDRQIKSSKQSLADPDVVKSFPEDLIERAKKDLIELEKDRAKIKDIPMRDCGSLEP